MLVAGLTGCASPPPPPTGFLSDYASLEKVDRARAEYLSPELKNYRSFIVDSIEIQEVNDPPVLTPEQRDEVALYMHQTVVDLLERNGFEVAGQSGANIARIRLAVTKIKPSTWWLNLHPGSKFSGLGTGGAAMEGEIIDSLTGRQLAAAVRSDLGNQFELDTFSKLDDIKDVIDRWAKQAEARLQEPGFGE